MIWTLYRGVMRPQLQPIEARPRESRAGWVLLVVSVVAIAWGMAGVRACAPTAEAAPPPELGPCSPVQHLCSVDPVTLEPVNRWTYLCPWGEEVRDLPWPCPESKARPTSETDVLPDAVIGPCYFYTDICADGYEKDWLVDCTGPLGFQWAHPIGKTGEVCDG